MRRIVSGVAVGLMVLAMSTPASAQDVSVGAELGVNIADLSLDPDSDTESLTGLRGGISLTKTVGSEGSFAVKSGVFYSEKGTTATANTTTYELSIGYVEVPVLGVFNIPSEGGFQPHLSGGGLIGIEASCDQSFTSGSTSASGSCDGTGLETASIDFGLLFGGGLGFEVSENTVVSVDAMYNLGLADIDDTANSEAKHRVFQLSAGVQMGL